MLLIIPTNSFEGDEIVCCATRWLTVAAALRRPNGSTVGALHVECSREGETVQVLPRRLGSKGDIGLALKPPVVEADGGERLDGGVGQRQLSSHHDDEVQVTEMHVCARDPADCMASHPRPDMECAKVPYLARQLSVFRINTN